MDMDKIKCFHSCFNFYLQSPHFQILSMKRCFFSIFMWPTCYRTVWTLTMLSFCPVGLVKAGDGTVTSMSTTVKTLPEQTRLTTVIQLETSYCVSKELLQHRPGENTCCDITGYWQGQRSILSSWATAGFLKHTNTNLISLPAAPICPDQTGKKVLEGNITWRPRKAKKKKN